MKIAHLLPVMLFGAVAIALGLGLRKDPSILPTMLMDRPLPAFEAAAIEPGKPLLNSTDVAKGPSLLNVFASWCASCHVEHPRLIAIAKEGRFPLYGLDWKDKPEDGAAWVAEKGNPYRIIGNDQSGRIGIDLGVSGVPETFIIDRRGRVRYRQVGPITDDVWFEVLLPLLKKLETEA